MLVLKALPFSTSVWILLQVCSKNTPFSISILIWHGRKSAAIRSMDALGLMTSDDCKHRLMSSHAESISKEFIVFWKIKILKVSSVCIFWGQQELQRKILQIIFWSGKFIPTEWQLKNLTMMFFNLFLWKLHMPIEQKTRSLLWLRSLPELSLY